MTISFRQVMTVTSSKRALWTEGAHSLASDGHTTKETAQIKV